MIHSYASGDGALHFSDIEGGKCTGAKITLFDAQCYLQGEQSHERLLGWRAILLNGLPVLVAPVNRLTHNKLELDGHSYYYQIDESRRFPDGQITDYAVSFLFPVPDVGFHELQNWSIRAQLIHFLNHEKELAAAL